MSKVANNFKEVLPKQLEEDPAPPITIDEWAKGCKKAFPLYAEPIKRFLEEQDKKSQG